MNVARSIADGVVSPRSALRQGLVGPSPRVHHRSPGVHAISPLPRSGCAQRMKTEPAHEGTEETHIAY